LAEHETGEPETRIFFPSFWVLLCIIFLLINSIRRRGHWCYYLKIGDYFAGTPCEHNMLEGNWRTFLWCTCLSVQWVILQDRCTYLQSRTIKVRTNQIIP
jgi:hypothetical protein